MIAPWSAVKTWQVVCECGRRVDAWDVQHPAWTDSSGSDYPACVTRDCPQEISDRLHDHWARAHADKLDGLAHLTRLIAERRALDVQIDDAAAAAMETGATWADLGRDAGISRQGAMSRPTSVR